MSEDWRPVPRYAGLYEVSNLGRVRSLDRMLKASNQSGPHLRRQPGRILTPIRGGAGKNLHRYWRVVLIDREGTKHRVYVHRLVTEAFLGPCPDGQQVRHGPGGSLDNSLENLSYGTPQENHEDMVRDGTRRRPETTPGVKLTWEKVRRIRELHAAGIQQKELAKEFGTSKPTISDIIRNITWKEPT